MKNKLIKGFSFLILILLCLCFAACDEHREQYNHKNGEKICGLEAGMTYDEANSVIEKNNILAHRNYIFLKDDSEGNVVIEFDKECKAISNIQAFDSSLTVEDGFQKIKSGMTVFEVVELVGIPTASVTFGLSSLEFECQDQKSYRIIWDGEMKVSEVIPVTQGDSNDNRQNDDNTAQTEEGETENRVLNSTDIIYPSFDKLSIANAEEKENLDIDTEKINEALTISAAVDMLGKPLPDTRNSIYPIGLSWSINDGEVLLILFEADDRDKLWDDIHNGKYILSDEKIEYQGKSRLLTDNEIKIITEWTLNQKAVYASITKNGIEEVILDSEKS